MKVIDIFTKYPLNLFTTQDIMYELGEEDQEFVVRQLKMAFASDYPLMKLRVRGLTYYGLLGAFAGVPEVDLKGKVTTLIILGTETLWKVKVSKRRNYLNYLEDERLEARLYSRLASKERPKSCQYPH